MSRELDRPIDVDPDADEPFGIDWEDYCQELGADVVIASCAWQIFGPDQALTVHDDTITASPSSGTASRATKAWFTGGTRGATYTATARIVTNGTPPARGNRSIELRIKDR